MNKFEIIEHTADTGIHAYGSSMEEVFQNCALGMMAIMMDTASVRARDKYRIEAEGTDEASLLICWLGEILYQVEAEGRAFREFKVEALASGKVEGWGKGEPLDAARHSVLTQIKAPTYHMLELEEKDGTWNAQVIFDV